MELSLQVRLGANGNSWGQPCGKIKNTPSKNSLANEYWVMMGTRRFYYVHGCFATTMQMGSTRVFLLYCLQPHEAMTLH